MKNFKKLMALVIAAVMVVATMNLGALAATDNLNHNTTLKVEGLDEGDSVTYYHIIKWDQEAERVKDNDGNPIGWDWDTAHITTGGDITDALLLEIVGTQDASGQIKDTTADKLAAAAKDGVSTGTVGANGTWELTSGVEPGLYMIIVTANSENGTIYNPIFVAANFHGDNTSTDPADSANQIKVSADELTYSNNARAKKSSIPLNKTAKGNDPVASNLDDANPEGVDVGEIVVFEVTTKAPKFPADYTNPKFALRDTLVGLTLDQNSIEVYAGTDKTGTKLTKDTDYTVTDISATGYTVTLTKTYLDSVAAAGQDIYVTYKAEVSDSAQKIINQEKNTVDLIFSTSPTDSEGSGRKRDRTNHYTFSIDANLLGDSNVESSSTEAIKVGRDAEGNPIMESVSYWNGATYHPALEGALFGLYKTEADANAGTATNPGNVYTNDVFTTGTVTSDANGRLTIKGLDEGTYYLKELKAPTGFIRHQGNIEVKIEATYSEPEANAVTEIVDGVEVTYYDRQLLSYKVTVGGTETEYSIVHSNSYITESQVKRITTSDEEIVNTKGVELPSTGGMGTTLFYAIGAILVLGAGILLVSKRRMAAN